MMEKWWGDRAELSVVLWREKPAVDASSNEESVGEVESGSSGKILS
jgi:hypothetical protein